MRFLVGILKWAVIVVAVLFGAFLLVNAFDEELKPEAAAFVELPKARIADAENAYYTFIGFYAPAGADAHATGKKIIAAYEAALAKEPYLESFNPDQHLGGAKLALKGKLGTSCAPARERCLERYQAGEALFDQFAADNQTLLERYRSLYSYPHFEETATPGMAVPLAGQPVQLVPVVNARIALAVKRGEFTQALDALERDIAFWRRVLRESGTLLSKAVAVSALHRGYRLLSELAELDGAAPHLTRMGGMIALLEPQDVDVSECIRWEAAMGARQLRSMSAGKSVWSVGYLRNATLNRAYERTKTYADLARLPASRYSQARQEIERREREEASDRLRALWRVVRNPVGSIVLEVSMGFPQYSERMHDLDGLTRLVALQVQILEKGLSQVEIPGFLMAAGERYADPYTGKPMQWDPEQQQIFFKGLSKQLAEGGIVALRIRAPATRTAAAHRVYSGG